MLDHLVSQLEERFSDTSLCYINEFLNLLLSKLLYVSLILLEEKIFLTTFYINDLPEDYPIDMELQAWYLKWKHHPKAKEVYTLPKALAALDKATFPNLAILYE